LDETIYTVAKYRPIWEELNSALEQYTDLLDQNILNGCKRACRKQRKRFAKDDNNFRYRKVHEIARRFIQSDLYQTALKDIKNGMWAH